MQVTTCLLYTSFGGRHRHRLNAEAEQLRRRGRIGDAGVDLFVELVDDLYRRVLGYTNPVP